MKKLLSAPILAALMLLMTACGCSASTDVSSSDAPMSSSSGNTALSGNAYDGGETRIGLGIVTNTSGSTAASADTDGSASFDLTACALTVDEQDRIIDVRFDAVEAGVGFDYSGSFTGDINSEISTKRELGDDYGLGAVSDIGMNWYEQMDAFEDWLRGKTVNEAMGMQLVYDGDDQIPDEDDLRSSVTISVSDQLRALERAYADATGSFGMAGGSGMTDGSAGSGGTAGGDDSPLSDSGPYSEDESGAASSSMAQ